MFGRRKRDVDDEAPEETPDAGPGPAGGSGTTGPYDAQEVDEDDGVVRVDLGGLLIEPAEGIELRLQADQASGVVQSVVLVRPDGALELRAFAAPKSGGLWTEVRREIVADVTKQGGTATAMDGSLGAELRIQVPVQAPDGRSGMQVSRVVGAEGPRWLLRGSFFGAAAGPEHDGVLERAFCSVVVVRGQVAMPPREPIPLRLPPEARA